MGVKKFVFALTLKRILIRHIKLSYKILSNNRSLSYDEYAYLFSKKEPNINCTSKYVQILYDTFDKDLDYKSYQESCLMQILNLIKGDIK